MSLYEKIDARLKEIEAELRMTQQERATANQLIQESTSKVNALHREQAALELTKQSLQERDRALAKQNEYSTPS